MESFIFMAKIHQAKRIILLLVYAKKNQKFNLVDICQYTIPLVEWGKKSCMIQLIKILESAYFSAFTPDRLLSKYNLINLKEAYTEIHNPTSEQNYMVALESVQVQNLIPLIAINEYNKKFYNMIKC